MIVMNESSGSSKIIALSGALHSQEAKRPTLDSLLKTCGAIHAVLVGDVLYARRLAVFEFPPFCSSCNADKRFFYHGYKR